MQEKMLNVRYFDRKFQKGVNLIEHNGYFYRKSHLTVGTLRFIEESTKLSI